MLIININCLILIDIIIWIDNDVKHIAIYPDQTRNDLKPE